MSAIPRPRQLMLLAAGTVGGLSIGAYGLLNGQSKQARSVIVRSMRRALRADGDYEPPRGEPKGEPLRFAVLGDSTAAGLGASRPDALPGVLLAKELAAETGLAVRLRTHAFSGATTRELESQVDAALRDRPELAVVIIGGNDVTTKMPIRTSAALLGAQLARLCAAGTAVVLCSCPDLRVIKPIPQPLRAIVGQWSRALASAQRAVAETHGVTLFHSAELLSPEFGRRPELFSADRFHPGDEGYRVAACLLLGPLLSTLRAEQRSGRDGW
ncbi:lysophospholipase L1-like esterase [Tamaricihabitans halophyticus]|uniref:Lysophospholipase L1-like esterase n=1 Tax=Tamaricihabitans halophyticus TaxID=1262583 RepID=A0A4R2R9H0_9PSEU|nr:SGNH/GDSL hydrolase family protein [Tamaricihabitans halophyticus]TCP56321.1 lysophospholipase L1-like esterase [Tamaricihabitans halophyticus]